MYTRRVFRIIFTGYAQSQKIGKPTNLYKKKKTSLKETKPKCLRKKKKGKKLTRPLIRRSKNKVKH